MKKILWLILLCFSNVLNAGVIDDGVITTGEYGYFIDIYNDDVLCIDGGGANRITMHNYSQLYISSTSSPLASGTSGVWSIVLDNYSSLTFSGGITNGINLHRNATALLTGGQINYLASYQIIDDTKNITIECFPGWTWFYEDGIVEGIIGTWADGTDFTINFDNKTDNGYDYVYKNINVVEIPEPATFSLFGLGGLFLKRKYQKV